MDGRYQFLLSLLLTALSLGALAQSQGQLSMQELDEQLSKDLQADLEALQSSEANAPEISPDDFDQIQKDLNSRDAMNRQKNPRNSFHFQKATKERQPPWEPIPFRAKLKKGAPLFHRSNDEKPIYKLGRSIFAKVVQMERDSDRVWIINNDGEKQYWTQMDDLIAVEEELTLTPKISAREEYPEKKRHHTTNEKLKLRHSFSYGLATQRSQNFQENISSELTDFSGQTFDYTLSPIWELPISFGWTIRYETLTAQLNDGSNLNLQSLSTGPRISYTPKTWGRLGWEVGLELTRSLSSQATLSQTSQNITLTNDFYRVLLDNKLHWKNNWGIWSVGLRIGQESQQVSVEDSTFPAEQEPQLIYGLIFGYAMEMDINI